MRKATATLVDSLVPSRRGSSGLSHRSRSGSVTCASLQTSLRSSRRHSLYGTLQVTPTGVAILTTGSPIYRSSLSAGGRGTGNRISARPPRRRYHIHGLALRGPVLASKIRWLGRARPNQTAAASHDASMQCTQELSRSLINRTELDTQDFIRSVCTVRN